MYIYLDSLAMNVYRLDLRIEHMIALAYVKMLNCRH